MLINVRVSELHSDSWGSEPCLFLAFLVGIAFYSSIVLILPLRINWITNIYSALDVFCNEKIQKPYDINLSSSDKWDGNFLTFTEISSIGNILYSSHGLWLMVTSVILLLAMIGVIVITVSPTISPEKSYDVLLKKV